MHAPAGPYAMVLREFDRNAIVVIGRTDPAALERVVNAYGSYPDHN
jgi:acetoacetate decarboxylase